MFDQEARQWLLRLLGPNVRFDEPMAPYTSFRIGGPADALVLPESESQLKEILRWARQGRIPYLVIGGGTNLLIRDGGIRGLVIHLGRLGTEISWEVEAEQVHLQAGAAVPTRRLCRIALRQGWQGLNFALGIPGTLGGGISMNAGTAGGTMVDVLEAITAMTADGKIIRLARESMRAQYRCLRLLDEVDGGGIGRAILLNGELNLSTGDRQLIREEACTLMRQRVRRQPEWHRSAGCFFKNPSADASAGFLIDKAGLKGLRIGDAQVSRQHANFIVNLGGARAADVLALASRIQDRVQSLTGISLVPEVRVVGEEKTDTPKPL